MQHSGGMKPIRFYESNERASAKMKTEMHIASIITDNYYVVTLLSAAFKT